jgi:phage baseplate assembly protein W
MASGRVKTFSFKSSGEINPTDRSMSNPKTIVPLSIKTPLQLGQDRTGLLDMHTDPRQMIKDNLKNLLLTNRGERLGNADIGANLQDLCSERVARDAFDAEAMLRIQKTVGRFMPFVELEDYSSKIESSEGTAIESMAVISITVVYNVPKFKVVKDTVGVVLNTVG